MIGMMLIFVLHTGGNEGVMCTKCKALMLPEDFYSLFHLLDYVLFLSVLEHVKFSLSGLTCLVKLSIAADDPQLCPQCIVSCGGQEKIMQIHLHHPPRSQVCCTIQNTIKTQIWASKENITRFPKMKLFNLDYQIFHKCPKKTLILFLFFS